MIASNRLAASSGGVQDDDLDRSGSQQQIGVGSTPTQVGLRHFVVVVRAGRRPHGTSLKISSGGRSSVSRSVVGVVGMPHLTRLSNASRLLSADL